MPKKNGYAKRFPSTAKDVYLRKLKAEAFSLLSQGSEGSDVIDYFVQQGHPREFSRKIVAEAYNRLTTPT